MSNVVRLDIVGDASSLEKATKQGTAATKKMSDEVGSSSQKIEKSFAKVTSGALFLTNGLSDLGSGIAAVRDLSRDGAIKADRLARAQNNVAQAAQDVEQATLDVVRAQVDFQQSLRDSSQALIDLDQAQRDIAKSALDVEQAQLDVEQATKDYADAVKKFGRNSIEARQADLDRRKALEDLAQAQLDSNQAAEDGQQAALDYTKASADGTQATLDGKQAVIDAKSAQLDLNEAQRDAIPPSTIEDWANKVSALTPLLFTAIGALQLLTTWTKASAIASGIAKAATVTWTASQWLLDAALTANPIGIVIVAIAALIAVIVLIATKTTWFQTIWKTTTEAVIAAGEAVGSFFKDKLWHGYLEPIFSIIGDTASKTFNFFKELPDKLKGWLSGIGDIIKNAFKSAFNWVTDRFNSLIHGANSVINAMNKVPGINLPTIPDLPRLHTGGRVPGLPGHEVLAILQGGETVVPAGGSGGGGDGVIVNVYLDGVKAVQQYVKNNGGNVQVALGRGF